MKAASNPHLMIDLTVSPTFTVSSIFSTMQHLALIPAAGNGQRFGAAIPKQYALLAGQPMLHHTAARLLAFSLFDAVVVCVNPQDIWVGKALADLACPRLHILFEGGDTRAATVRQSCAWLREQGTPVDCNIWVHDAARPGIQTDDLRRLHAALSAGASTALLALPVADTLKRAEGHQIATTVDRASLWQAQTPQVAPLSTLFAALNAASGAMAAVTDEAGALERIGVFPTLVQGSGHNFKVTTAADGALVALILHPPPPPKVPCFRIGEGMDVHALVAGRPLVLGGITVPHTHGLLGHSDADALCHAITDALLGAAGLGDIGRMFPDTDAQYAGADSTVLLAQAYAAVRAVGWQLGNLDATIIAQSPKLSAHIPAMQARLAQVLDCSEAQLNIKAKTNEALGFLGRKEGIECRASVLLYATCP